MADTDRADGDDPDPETVAVTFHPGEWVDSPGETHDWDGPYYVTVTED